MSTKRCLRSGDRDHMPPSSKAKPKTKRATSMSTKRCLRPGDRNHMPPSSKAKPKTKSRRVSPDSSESDDGDCGIAWPLEEDFMPVYNVCFDYMSPNQTYPECGTSKSSLVQGQTYCGNRVHSSCFDYRRNQCTKCTHFDFKSHLESLTDLKSHDGK